MCTMTEKLNKISIKLQFLLHIWASQGKEKHEVNKMWWHSQSQLPSDHIREILYISFRTTCWQKRKKILKFFQKRILCYVKRDLVYKQFIFWMFFWCRSLIFFFWGDSSLWVHWTSDEMWDLSLTRCRKCAKIHVNLNLKL